MVAVEIPQKNLLTMKNISWTYKMVQTVTNYANHLLTYIMLIVKSKKHSQCFTLFPINTLNSFNFDITYCNWTCCHHVIQMNDFVCMTLKQKFKIQHSNKYGKYLKIMATLFGDKHSIKSQKINNYECWIIKWKQTNVQN